MPLYKALYEKFRGGVIPPTAALEREIVALGVSEKQKERARQVFERAADQAGFSKHGKNRLVMPGAAAGREPINGENKSDDNAGVSGGGGGGGGGGSTEIDPIIRGLLARLPPSGSQWRMADRKLWLELLEGSFKLIYEDVPEIWTDRVKRDDAAN